MLNRSSVLISFTRGNFPEKKIASLLKEMSIMFFINWLIVSARPAAGMLLLKDI